ncbi:putative C-type lectin domain family 20 member A [Paramisgurnus dabryanus]|uniref:putative C-type lectin domain family 20 member A n=1 Tax=Paramisgurnus dabryanus TaxID=90735 RepID=UPI0031F3E6EC
MKTSFILLLFLNLFELHSGLFRRHYYVNDHKKWNDAQKHCRDNYDDLSTVSHPDLQTLSTNPALTDNKYWIGLYADNIWKWSEGGTATINYWKGGQHNPSNDRCGYADKTDSKVDDDQCSSEKTFYCMEDYELVLVKQESTWEEALDYCRQNYLDLAILYSAVVMTEAKNNSTNAQTDELWTGLRFLSGHWFWVNGENLQYEAWSGGGEPQCPAMNQRCGVYHRQEMAWKPEDCEKKLNFLCVNRKN